MKTLFLDFDGVLHPNLPRAEQRFQHAPLLAQALGHVRVDVVVSSSWRFHRGLAHLVSTLPPALRDRIVDTTGPAIIGRHSRWQEIRAWASLHRVSDWRALDDAVFEFPTPCPELIACDGARGISPTEIDLLRQWLS